MRESFVIYTEWVEDLPEDYRKVFLMYIYQYGAHGQAPELQGLERALWIKIQRRMDADAEKWNETKERRSAAGRAGGIKSAQMRKASAQASALVLDEKPAPEMLQDAAPTQKPEPQKTAPRFVKPTLEEIRGYCQERNNLVNAEQFFDFYQAKGWKVGRNPMKDWRAAVRTWEQRSQTPRTPVYGNAPVRMLPADRLTL